MIFTFLLSTEIALLQRHLVYILPAGIDDERIDSFFRSNFFFFSYQFSQRDFIVTRFSSHQGKAIFLKISSCLSPSPPAMSDLKI